MRMFCALIVAGLIAGSNASAEPEGYAKDYIAAIVNDTIITRGQVEEFARPAIEPLFRAYQQPEAQKINAVLSEALEHMVENRLILDDFKTGGAHVPDAIVDDEIKDRIRTRGQDRAGLIKELHAQGMTIDAFRQQIREEMILHYMTQKNVSSAILISPQKVERYYTTNMHQYKLGNQVKLRMIVLTCSVDNPTDEVRKRAQEISDKLDEGVSFSEMATIYSQSSEQKQGGDLGWMDESKTSRGFADVAASLKPGQHSGVVGYVHETNDVYWMYLYNKAGHLSMCRKYTDKVQENQLLEEKKFENPMNDINLPVPPQEFRLMMVENRRIARTESLTEVREKIEKELLAQEKERLRKKWVERLKAKAFVRLVGQ